MYEMEGPRPVSRHRPADFSASIAPLDYLPGPGTLPSVPVATGSPGGSGSPRRGSGLALCQQAGVSPKPAGARYFPHRVAQGFLSPINRGFPKPKGSRFPFADRLRAFFSARDSGLPLRHSLKSLPFAGWLRGSPSRVSPFAGWHQAFPEARGPKVSRDTGGPGFPPHRWLGVSSSPVAPVHSLPKPEVSLCRVARVSPSPVPVPGGTEISTPIARAAQGVSGSNFKILWPSTSHPQLTPSCPPRRAASPPDTPQVIHRRGRRGCPGAGQASAG